MKNILGMLGLAVGGYLLYSQFAGAGIGNSVGAGDSSGSTGITPNLKAKLLTAANGTDAMQMNADQWGFYYAQVTGHEIGSNFGPLFIDPYNGDRSKLYTVNEFITVLQTRGMAGLGCYGLGGLYVTSPGGFNGGGATWFERAAKGIN